MRNDFGVALKPCPTLLEVLGSPPVKDLTKYLDPSGLGVISFEDFHRGIRAIRNGGESGAAVQSPRGIQ
ncbi:Peroxisomal 2,4-dienoyl-CoA reductase [Aix galericulata]|nr:Peroxisomal 2,4-dienoyl-CoA reductase [Aix galericulata]